MRQSTLLHLRFPFSFFLLPVYLFALSVSNNPDLHSALITGFILHLLLYPASNGYNSYFDKDEGSIGGLKSPPKVTAELYYVSLSLDFIALTFSLYFIGTAFTILILFYGLVSKAYSHPSFRLKKYPVSGWLTIFFFQGYFTFITCYIGINGTELSDVFTLQIQLPAMLSSILFGGSYPMTQIYQHEEDRVRGDLTISRLLGILGTFHFTAIMFTLAMGGFIFYYLTYFDLKSLLLLQIILLPSLVYFISWYLRVRKNEDTADYSSTMKLNMISSLMLNIFFFIEIVRH